MRQTVLEDNVKDITRHSPSPDLHHSHSRPESSIAHSAEASQPVTPRVCQAQSTDACRERGGRFEPGRQIRQNTRFCYDCRRQRRRALSAQWKRRKRANGGWREMGFATDEQRRLYQGIYRQAQRGWQQQQSGSTLNPAVARQQWLDFLYHQQVRGGLFRKRPPPADSLPAAA